MTRSDLERRAPSRAVGGTATYDAASCSLWNARGHGKITQHMYQRMSERSGGGCSAI